MSLVGLLDTLQLAVGRKAALGVAKCTGVGMWRSVDGIKMIWNSEGVAMLSMT